MTILKLQSSDGVIFTVDVATVKQLVTIQTMIDHEDEDSEEIIPVFTMKARVLEKIIQCTEFHKDDHEKAEKTNYCLQYFHFHPFQLNLKMIFEIIIAADYLEVKSLLLESCRNVLINYKREAIEDAATSFHDPKALTLLNVYKRQQGYEVIVILLDDKYLKYFDAKVNYEESIAIN